MCAKKSQLPPPGASPGALIKYYRLAAGLTQKQLAGDQFSSSYISVVECGKIKPSLKLLEWCASVLNVAVADLLGDEDASGFDRAQRQRAAEGGYQLVRAEMLLAAGEIASATETLRAIHQRLGAKTPKPAFWLSAYVAYLEGDLETARAGLDRYGSPTPTPDNPLEAAAYHWLRGLIARAEGALSLAVDEHLRALMTGASSFIDPDFAIGVRASLAETLLRARAFDQAYETQAEALRLYENLGSPARHAAQARRLAEEAAEARDYARAYRLTRWAEIMYREARTMRQIFAMALQHALSPAPVATEPDPERDLLLALSIAQRLDDAAQCQLVSALLALVCLQQGGVEQGTRYAEEGRIADAFPIEQRPPIERAVLTLARSALAYARSRHKEAISALVGADAALAAAGDGDEQDAALLRFAYQAALWLAKALDVEQAFMPLLRRALRFSEPYGR